MDVDIAENKKIVCQCIREVLPSAKLLSDERLEKRIGKEKLVELTEELVGFCYSGVRGELTRLELSALICQVLRSLSRYVAKMEIPFTVNTLQNNIGLLEFAVNQDFPGYSDSKLLKYTITPVKVA